MKIAKLLQLTDREISALDETLDGYEIYFVKAIQSGECELWEINSGESFAITRLEIDNDRHKTTLAVCCYKGKDLNLFVDHITEIADKNKWFIRFHTYRLSLSRWMQRSYKFNETEHILHRSPL